MTMTTPLSQTTVIQAAKEAFFASMPDHFQRLQWDSEQLARLQTQRLHELLRVAVDRSAFRHGRLGDLDPETATLDLLPSLPPMTKAEMMGAYDDVVTDRRITLEGLQHHLDEVGDEPVLHLDEFVVLASGGSSGVRGIYASDLKAASEQMAAVVRGGLARVAAMMDWPLPGPIPTTIVAAASCVHATRALSSTFLDGRMNTITFAPATLPFAEIVRRVAAAQPMLLIGYPSLIARLADEQLDGRLSIEPMAVTVTSEHLTADSAARISAGFGVPPTNSYGTSEGLMGTPSRFAGVRLRQRSRRRRVRGRIRSPGLPRRGGAPRARRRPRQHRAADDPLPHRRRDDRESGVTRSRPPASEPGGTHRRAADAGRDDRPPVDHPIGAGGRRWRERISGTGHRQGGRRQRGDLRVGGPTGHREAARNGDRQGWSTRSEGQRPIGRRHRRDPRTGKARRFVTT